MITLLDKRCLARSRAVDCALSRDEKLPKSLPSLVSNHSFPSLLTLKTCLAAMILLFSIELLYYTQEVSHLIHVFVTS
jgi:amino acid transporter